MANEEFDKKKLEDYKKVQEDVLNIQKEMSTDFMAFFRVNSELLKIKKNTKKLDSEIASIEQQIKDHQDKKVKLTKGELSQLKEQHAQYKLISSQSKEILATTSKTRSAFVALGNEVGNFVKGLNMFDYIMESDKALKGLQTNLGVTYKYAASYRDNIQGAAGAAARLGSSIEDLTTFQTSFTEETGKLAPLTELSLKKMSAMSNAINMSAEDTGKMVANFDLIGLSFERTAEFVESSLHEGTKFGISGKKTVELVNQNFSKLNNFRFAGGVDSFKKMVQYSQVTKQNLESVFAATEKFRTLEGAIEAASELQTIGGSFANVDPFQMGFLARNDPEAFTKKLHEMSKGLAAINKDGQFDISAVNMDRLRRVSEITGQNFEDLQVEAKKMSKTQFITEKTFGLTEEQKMTVAQLATFDQTSKTFKVQIDGKNLDISQINSKQAEMLTMQKESLEQMSVNAQSFDKSFDNTVMQLKSAVLPLLEGLNKGLQWLNGIGDGMLGDASKIAAISAAAIAFKAGGMALNAGLKGVGERILNKGIGKFTGGGKGDSDDLPISPDTSRNRFGRLKKNSVDQTPSNYGTDKFAGSLDKIPAKADLMGKAAGIAAIGVAAVGIGAGIYLATKGVSAMAESLKGLSSEQLKYLAINLGIITTGMVAMGVAGTFAGPGIMMAGAGFALIGAGIGVAAWGVGQMATGLSKLSDPNIGKSMMDIGTGIGSIALGSASLGNPLSLAGLAATSLFVNTISKGVDFSSMTTAFSNANAFMKAPTTNLDKLKETIASLKNADLSGLTQMKDLFSKPLQVEFKDKQVSLTVNVDTYIDSDKVARTMQIGRRATIETSRDRKGA